MRNQNSSEPGGKAVYRSSVTLEPGKSLKFTPPTGKIQHMKADFAGNSDPYDIELTPTHEHNYRINVTKNGNLSASLQVIMFGTMQVATSPTGKQVLLFVSNGGSGGFIQEARILGDDGKGISCLIDLLNQALSKVTKSGGSKSRL